MTKISGGPKGHAGVGLDPEGLQELEELKQQMATQAVQGIGPQVDAPAQGPSRSNGARGDRRGAQARISQGAVRSENVQQTQAVRGLSNDAELQQLTEQLQKMGYLPKPPAKIDQQMIEEATRKAIGEHLNDANPDMDVEQLFSMIEAMLQKDNARRNGGGGGARPGAPAQRPSSLPPASTYQNRGPAPNAGALQQQAARSVATAQPPPEPGSINARVAEATQRYMGTSTAAGPDGGNLACAWSVNNILSNAGLQKVGSNPNYVPSVEQALQGGRGTAIEARDARPGDIVIWPNGHHIGIAMGNGQVANNSSSRAAFVNMQNLPAGARVYRLNS